MPVAAEKLSAATGKPIRYVAVDPEEAEQARLAAGMPAHLAAGLTVLFAERRRGKESKVWDTMQSVFGLKPTTFDEFARRNAAIFRGEQAFSAR